MWPSRCCPKRAPSTSSMNRLAFVRAFGGPDAKTRLHYAPADPLGHSDFRDIQRHIHTVRSGLPIQFQYLSVHLHLRAAEEQRS